VKKMPLNKDWTIEDLAELRLALEFRRAPAEIATSLGRDERDVERKINEIGLDKRGQKMCYQSGSQRADAIPRR
jgi:hypothetical protein